MGKITKLQQQQLHDQNPTSQIFSPSSSYFCHSCCCSTCLPRIRNSFSFKCALVLILSLALFLSALFWIPPFNRLNSGSDVTPIDDHTVAAKASFRLQKPVSLLAAHTKTLENDILDEIGVPNTKISILSINQSTVSNWTDVVFGVLPDRMDAPINLASLSVLKSSLIELFLHHLNLSLTTSIFGKPSSFEILKFSGGITVIPAQSFSIWQMPQILFNFTLNNSISQIEDSFDQLKYELKSGLELRFDENIFVQLTNRNGSTVKAPVVVQISVIGSSELLPQRLKQLAEKITGSPAKNLGLDHTVFGKVKGVSLSSVLNNSLETSSGSPSPSPAPAPSPSGRNYYSAPSVSPRLAPSPSPSHPPSSDGHNLSPCSDPYAPNPSSEPQVPIPLSPESAAPAPNPVPTTDLRPIVPPVFPPRASTQRPMGPTPSPLADVSPSPSMPYSTSSGKVPCDRNTWLIGSLGILILHLARGLH